MALILKGVRTPGWPRPILIVAGILLVLAPVVMMWLDFTYGHWVVTVR